MQKTRQWKRNVPKRSSIFYARLFFRFSVCEKHLAKERHKGLVYWRACGSGRSWDSTGKGKRLSRGSCWWSRNCHRRVVELGRNEWQSFYMSLKSMHGDRWSCIYRHSIYPSGTTDAGDVTAAVVTERGGILRLRKQAISMRVGVLMPPPSSVTLLCSRPSVTSYGLHFTLVGLF